MISANTRQNHNKLWKVTLWYTLVKNLTHATSAISLSGSLQLWRCTSTPIQGIDLINVSCVVLLLRITVGCIHTRNLFITLATSLTNVKCVVVHSNRKWHWKNILIHILERDLTGVNHVIKHSGRKAHCVTTERYITVRSKISAFKMYVLSPVHQQCIYILAFVHMERPNSIIDASLEQQFTLVVQGNHYEPKLKDVFYQWHTRLSKNTPWTWLSIAPLQSVGPFHCSLRC